MNHDEACSRLLDAAEQLFYERGVQAVGMDELRAASGVSLKRLYQCFSSKSALVEGYLRRRDERWRADLSDYVARHGTTPEDRLLAVFDWLHEWFAAPGFRGCAFINSFGELGATSDGAASAARDHKHAVREYVAGLARDLRVDDPAAPATPAAPAALASLADQVALLMDGAITTAAISGDPAAAQHARAAAETLVACATRAGLTAT